MNCKSCKRELEMDWSYCPYCGRNTTRERPPRRANGTGSVYKRGSTWTAMVSVGTKRVSRSGFSTKTAALQYLSQLAQAPEQKTKTLEYYWRSYEGSKLEKISDSKRTAYRIAWSRLLPLKDRPISTISIVELQDILTRETKTYYPARDLRTLLNHLYRLAAADKAADPTLPGLLELPTLQETEQEVFTQQEQAALWTSYERGNTKAAMPLIMIYTGMMPGELQKLTVEMIDLEKKEIAGAGLKTPTRKKNSVLLPDAILPVLEDEMRRVGSGPLYPSKHKPEFYDHYYAALEQAGVRKLTPYACRHTAATALSIDKNVAPQTVQRLMRWASTRMMDRYVHPDENAAKRAVNKRKKV